MSLKQGISLESEVRKMLCHEPKIERMREQKALKYDCYIVSLDTCIQVNNMVRE